MSEQKKPPLKDFTMRKGKITKKEIVPSYFDNPYIDLGFVREDNPWPYGDYVVLYNARDDYNTKQFKNIFDDDFDKVIKDNCIQLTKEDIETALKYDRNGLLALERITDTNLNNIIRIFAEKRISRKSEWHINKDNHKISPTDLAISCRIWTDAAFLDNFGVKFYFTIKDKDPYIRRLECPLNFTSKNLENTLLIKLLTTIFMKNIFLPFSEYRIKKGSTKGRVNLLIAAAIGYHPRHLLRYVLSPPYEKYEKISDWLYDGFGKKIETSLKFEKLQPLFQTPVNKTGEVHTYGLSTLIERARYGSFAENPDLILNMCGVYDYTPGFYTTILCTKKKSISQMQDVFIREIKYNAEVAKVLHEIIQSEQQKKIAQKHILTPYSAWTNAEEVAENYINTKSICASEILEYNSEDKFAINESCINLDTIKFSDDILDFLHKTFEVSKTDFVTLSRLFSTTYAIPVYFNDHSQEKRIFVMAEAIATQLFIRVGFMPSIPNKISYRSSDAYCNVACLEKEKAAILERSQDLRIRLDDLTKKFEIENKELEQWKKFYTIAKDELEYYKTKLQETNVESTEINTLKSRIQELEDKLISKNLELQLEKSTSPTIELKIAELEGILKNKEEKIKKLKENLENERSQLYDLISTTIPKSEAPRPPEETISIQPPPPPPPPLFAPRTISKVEFFIKPIHIDKSGNKERLLNKCMKESAERPHPEILAAGAIPMKADENMKRFTSEGESVKKYCALSGKPFYVVYRKDNDVRSGDKSILDAVVKLDNLERLGPSKYPDYIKEITAPSEKKIEERKDIMTALMSVMQKRRNVIEEEREGEEEEWTSAPYFNITNKCIVCGLPAKGICGNCKRVAYCSIKCQKKDWNMHQHMCKTIII